MRSFIFKRLRYMLLLMALMTVFAFIVIQLPPGDYVSSYIMKLQAQMGDVLDPAQIDAIRKQYGMDENPVVQYFKWIFNMLRGDFGRSFEWNKTVLEMIGSRLPATLLLSILTLMLTYAVAIPIGIYSARKQYSILDYTFTTFGFIGLSMPSFFLALVLSYLVNKFTGMSVGGLYSPEFSNAPMSFAKFADLLKHLPLPILIIGLAGTAQIIRIMRGNMLDEKNKLYVTAARARGLKENTLIYKYPVRVALNPIISTIGAILPGIFSGATVTAIVLNIPTIGSLLYGALLSQDMYLAGACIMLLTFLTLFGTFISDVLLAIVDPRIRFS